MQTQSLRRAARISSIACALAALAVISDPPRAQAQSTLTDGSDKAVISATNRNGLRTYTLSSSAKLRGNAFPSHGNTFAEDPGHARVRTGSLMFDGLYALAEHEALQNSVSQITDGAFAQGRPLPIDAFQTGALWTYVWTRDLSYSTDLALAQFDPLRAESSLLFKTSLPKPSVAAGAGEQIIQDTGSGGSYPISTDRVVWSLGASRLAQTLPPAQSLAFVKQAYPVLQGTLEQDRRLIYNPADGLYRGEESFLDWREQTYPSWTKDSVLAIGESEALSTNCAHYHALRTAAAFAARLGRADESRRYAAWADALKAAINANFYDPDAGLYSSYLLTDGTGAPPVRAHRYDLLGESLAIVLGIAPEDRARRMIAAYPTGPYGPPVVWPEERGVPIYHNHAVWPFVTAYWTKAAALVGNADGVDDGIASLMQGAALNLSNMENFDVATGRTQVSHGVLSGPVVDSQRQIWSVAGYLSMVQDVVFGLQTASGGIRFQPFVTARARNMLFAKSSMIVLSNFREQGKTLTVRIHLPDRMLDGGDVCPIKTVTLNGQAIGNSFIPVQSLPPVSTWDITLGLQQTETPRRLPRRYTEATAFAPALPLWDYSGENGPITLSGGLLTLHFAPGNAAPELFNIYRDGVLCASNVKSSPWTDPRSQDCADVTHFYAIEAVDPGTRLASHLTQSECCLTEDRDQVIDAADLQRQGGNFVADPTPTRGHVEDWGNPGDTLTAARFTVPRDGLYLVRAEYANGAGPVNTGITCAVKRLEISRNDPSPAQALDHGYLVMPQLGDWQRLAFSSPVTAHLLKGATYSLKISEDAYSRNMSYLEKNQRYTANPGGGSRPYNFVNIAAVDLLWIGSK